MYAKIQEISTLSGTPMTYVLIHIWPTKKASATELPSGDNAFVMDLFKTSERVVKDAQGRHKTHEGQFIHPDRAKGSELWEMETYNIDVAAEVMANIEEYLERRKELEGNKDSFPSFHARPALVRTQDNPRGILSMSDVMGLVGKGVSVK